MHVAPTHIHHRGRLHRNPLTWLVALAVVIAVALLIQHGVVQRDDSGSALTGSGVSASEDRSLLPFSAVELAGSNQVAIRHGPAQNVTVRGDDNLLDEVTTEVRNGRLVVSERAPFRSVKGMRVDVTIPTLDSVALSGSGLISIEGIDTDVLNVSAAGSGVVIGSGRADRVDALLSGSGDLQLQQVLARDARAVVSGSGRIWVRAARLLVASVPGAGVVVYSGTPATLRQRVSGSGAVLSAGIQ
jgi:hypothetical protein